MAMLAGACGGLLGTAVGNTGAGRANKAPEWLNALATAFGLAGSDTLPCCCLRLELTLRLLCTTAAVKPPASATAGKPILIRGLSIAAAFFMGCPCRCGGLSVAVVLLALCLLMYSTAYVAIS